MAQSRPANFLALASPASSSSSSSPAVTDAAPVTTKSSAASLSRNYTYPYAPSPDIIRAHQKDAYFRAQLLTHLADIARSVYGARFAQTCTTELRVAADLLYLGLTTLIGNRTLGEEYCDVVSIEADTGRLPGWHRRAGSVLGIVVVPYIVGWWMPKVRNGFRLVLKAWLRRLDTEWKSNRKGNTVLSPSKFASSTDDPLHVRPSPLSRMSSVIHYFLRNLDAFTSTSPLYAASLAAFYFTGAYYHLSTRFLRLRYILTRDLTPGEAANRVGYEVLGVLLVLQLAVQAYLHARETALASAAAEIQERRPSSTAAAAALPVMANASTMAGTEAHAGPGVEVNVGADVSLDPNAYSSNNTLLFESSGSATLAAGATAEDQTKISRLTHTPVAMVPRIDLGQDSSRSSGGRSGQREVPVQGLTMGWLAGNQARKCTLCLEAMRDPAATTCGHLFCWACINEWVRERPECPLCRQECRAQHVLVLNG